MFKSATVIQSNKFTITGVPSNCKYAASTHPNDNKEAPVPIIGTNDFGIFPKPNPLIKKPISGNKGIRDISVIRLMFFDIIPSVCLIN